MGVSGGRCDGTGERGRDFGKRVDQPQASFGLVCGSALVVRGSSLRTRQARHRESGPCSHAVARFRRADPPIKASAPPSATGNCHFVDRHLKEFHPVHPQELS